MIDTGLAGRVVLVTGGAGGIGAAISGAFAAEGARVAIHHLAAQAEAPPGTRWEHTRRACSTRSRQCSAEWTCW